MIGLIEKLVLAFLPGSYAQYFSGQRNDSCAITKNIAENIAQNIAENAQRRQPDGGAHKSAQATKDFNKRHINQSTQVMHHYQRNKDNSRRTHSLEHLSWSLFEATSKL